MLNREVIGVWRVFVRAFVSADDRLNVTDRFDAVVSAPKIPFPGNRDRSAAKPLTKTRRGGSRPISPSYRTYSRSVKLLEDGAGSAGAVRTDGSAA
jgi:hypothetical protein